MKGEKSNLFILDSRMQVARLPEFLGEKWVSSQSFHSTDPMHFTYLQYLNGICIHLFVFQYLSMKTTLQFH